MIDLLNGDFFDRLVQRLHLGKAVGHQSIHIQNLLHLRIYCIVSHFLRIFIIDGCVVKDIYDGIVGENHVGEVVYICEAVCEGVPQFFNTSLEKLDR